MSTLIGPLELGERKRVTFDFSTEIPAGLVIDNVTVSITVATGEDPAANDVLDGLPTFDEQQAYQWVVPGVPGCTYVLKALATDDQGGIHRIPARMLVVR